MENYEKLIKPYTPVEVTENGKIFTANVIGRTYTFGEFLFSQINAAGEDLLAAPIHVTGIESGNAIEYNMTDSFIFERTEEQVTVCQALQSDEFIIDTAIKLEFDGCAQIDVKVMPRGLTVAECFGTAARKPRQYRLEKLTLEIPLKKAVASQYHIYPNGDIYKENGETAVTHSSVSPSGILKDGHYFLPFKPILWLGDDKRGFCLFAESDRYIEASDSRKYIEIVDDGDIRYIRLHLLDKHPESWQGTGGSNYHPLTYRMGMMATPIKPYPKQPYLHNALHIDCFKKLSCDYKEFMENPEMDGNAHKIEGESAYDRIKRLGVTTLIIHEKWNKIQNFPYISEPTAHQFETIIRECHKRGIKVIPYFGYEIATMSPLWGERSEEALVKNWAGSHNGGWWRVPPQRDYVVCYNSSWQDTYVQGIKNLIEKYHFDGIYLDSTLNVNACTNELHGCGYVGTDGKRHATYPLMAVRKMMRRLYAELEPLGAIINYHAFSCCNPTAMGFAHLCWNGESIQFMLLKEGIDKIPLDYLRAEYCGQHFGIPNEMIAYENRPTWTFEQATSFALIFGFLTRPNDIGYPLEFISEIWKVIDRFPIDRSVWHPYFEQTDMKSDNPSVVVSYWSYVGIDGKEQRLVFAANVTKEPLSNVRIDGVKLLTGTATEENGSYSFPSFGCGVFVG